MNNKNVTPIKKRSKKKANTKKIIIILIILAVFSAGVAVAVHFMTRLDNDSYKNCAMGDVNGDGYINSMDSLRIINCVIGNEELFENQKFHGDVNQDDELNSVDALIILRYVVGDVNALPYNDKVENNTVAQNNDKKAMSEGDNTLSTAQIVNEWINTDGSYSYQVNIAIKNRGDSSIEACSSSVVFSENVEITDNWNCDVNSSGQIMSLSCESIPAKSTVTCGVVLTSSEGLTINSIETE